MYEGKAKNKATGGKKTKVAHADMAKGTRTKERDNVRISVETENSYNCPTCEKEAEMDVIECEACHQWFHFACAGITEHRDWSEVEWVCCMCMHTLMQDTNRDKEHTYNADSQNGIIPENSGNIAGNIGLNLETTEEVNGGDAALTPTLTVYDFENGHVNENETSACTGNIASNAANSNAVKEGQHLHVHDMHDTETVDAAHEEEMGSMTGAVIMPKDTVESFVQAAYVNSQKKVETLGFLAGRREDGRVLVKAVIIPEQVGTTSTCECRQEEQVVACIRRDNLILVGWIHTHPIYDTFMSSIDVHTQYTIQKDVPEAFAIVCATEKGKNECYRLTQQGMKDVAECHIGGFHEGCGENTNWEAIKKPELYDIQIEVTDLRSEQNSVIQDDMEKGQQWEEDARPQARRTCKKNYTKKQGNMEKDEICQVELDIPGGNDQREYDATASKGDQQNKDQRQDGKEDKKNMKPNTMQRCSRNQVVQNVICNEELQENQRNVQALHTRRNESIIEEAAQKNKRHEQEADEEEEEEERETSQQGTMELDSPCISQGEVILIQENENHDGETDTREAESDTREQENGSEAETGECGKKEPNNPSKVKPKNIRKTKPSGSATKTTRVGLAAQVQQLKAENQKLRVQLHQLEQGKEVQRKTDQMDKGRISGEGLCGACASYLLWLHKQEQEKDESLRRQRMNTTDVTGDEREQQQRSNTETRSQTWEQEPEQSRTVSNSPQVETADGELRKNNDDGDAQKVHQKGQKSNIREKCQHPTEDESIQHDKSSQSAEQFRKGERAERDGNRQQQRKEMNQHKGCTEEKKEDSHWKNHDRNKTYGWNYTAGNQQQGRHGRNAEQEKGPTENYPPRYYRTRVWVNQRYQKAGGYRKHEEREWQSTHRYPMETKRHNGRENSEGHYYRSDNYMQEQYQQEQQEGGVGVRRFGKQGPQKESYYNRHREYTQVTPYYEKNANEHPSRGNWSRYEPYGLQDRQQRRKQSENDWGGSDEHNQPPEWRANYENHGYTRNYREDDWNYGTMEEWNEVNSTTSENQQQKKDRRQENWDSQQERRVLYLDGRRALNAYENFHWDGAGGNRSGDRKSYRQALQEKRKVTYQ